MGFRYFYSVICISLCLNLHLAATSQVNYEESGVASSVIGQVDALHDTDNGEPSSLRSTVVVHKLGTAIELACSGYEWYDSDGSTSYYPVQWSAPGSRIYQTKATYSEGDAKPGITANDSSSSNSSSMLISRVELLQNGSLMIREVQRLDAGLYVCRWGNDSSSSSVNDTFAVHFRIDSGIIFATKIESMLFGIACALSFLITSILVAAIRYVSFRCSAEEQQKRQSIRQLLERIQDYKAEKMVRFSARMDRLSAYKTAKMDQLFAFRTAKLDRLRTYKQMTMTNILHHVDRMRDHYATQSGKVKANCARQARGLRHKYHLRVARFNDYRSHHMDHLRDSYRGQLTRIHEYGSQQMDRLREQYRTQQQHIIKLMELLDIGNCASVVDEECKLAETLLFNPVLPLDELEADPLPADDADTLDIDCESIRLESHRHVSFAEDYDSADDSSVTDSVSLRALGGSVTTDTALDGYELALADEDRIDLNIYSRLAITDVMDETTRMHVHNRDDHDAHDARWPSIQQQQRRSTEPVDVRVHQCLVETYALLLEHDTSNDATAIASESGKITVAV
jgi:hypothetical protein